MEKLWKLGSLTLLSMLVIFGCSESDLEESMQPDIELKSYQSGTDEGFFWSLWTDDQAGYVDYQNGDGGNYSVSWDYDGNFTCGKGWGSGSANRVVGYNVGVHDHSGGGVFGYYGWSRSPLMEYYVNERWGSSRPDGGSFLGTVNSDGGTYDIYTATRYNAPSIDGTQTFTQIYSTRRGENSVGANHSITFANHYNAWANAGYQLGSDLSPAAILLTEAYGGNSDGFVNATVWEAGTSSGGGNNGGGNNGGGSQYPVGTELPLQLRARSTDGQGQVRLVVGGNAVATWTLGTSMSNYNISLWSSRGDMLVEFINDTGGRDIQVDYLSVGGSLRQAENQSYNTGVYQNGSCGGSNSEWLHCNGAIGFGDTP